MPIPTKQKGSPRQSLYETHLETQACYLIQNLFPCKRLQTFQHRLSIKFSDFQQANPPIPPWDETEYIINGICRNRAIQYDLPKLSENIQKLQADWDNAVSTSSRGMRAMAHGASGKCQMPSRCEPQRLIPHGRDFRGPDTRSKPSSAGATCFTHQ